jgi:hypothetical protein
MRRKAFFVFLLSVVTIAAQPQTDEMTVVSAASFTRNAALLADMIVTALRVRCPLL